MTLNYDKGKKYLFGFFHFFVFLIFLYSALSKTLKFDLFVSNLDESPFFENIGTSFIATFVIVIEYAIPLLLFFDKTTKIGYLMSFVLFFVFTGYIVMILKVSPYLPCSCGGLIETLSWTQHIYFNVFFLVVSMMLFLSYDDIHGERNKR